MGNRFWAGVAVAAMGAMWPGAASAEVIGAPRPWQLGFQESVTTVMNQIVWLHDFITIIIALITIFVLGLLVYVMVRFNERANPSPSRTTHNTAIEIAWTVLPILILVVIAVPSFRLLYAQYALPEADLTIKATGHQWYWTHEYPDEGILFDSVMVQDADLQPGQPRLLAVDNEVVVPVNANVHVLVTASDVIHSWAMPSFGVKLDAVPGRVLTTWFRAERTGIFYGQCSELCGRLHAFMPIAVRVVSQQDYAAWLERAKQTFSADAGQRKVAAVAPVGEATPSAAGGN